VVGDVWYSCQGQGEVGTGARWQGSTTKSGRIFNSCKFCRPCGAAGGFFAHQKYNQEFKINAKTPNFGRDLVARSTLGMGWKRIEIVLILVTKNRFLSAK